MSCSGCCAKFTFLSREKACSRCLLAFCSKCLVKDRSAPSIGNGKFLCKACTRGGFASYTAGRDLSSSNETCGKSQIEAAHDKSQLFEQEIAERLNKLKSPGNVPTAGELEEKLNSLRGIKLQRPIESYDTTPKANLAKNVEEDADNLFKEFVEENAISGQILSPDEEIARRLAKLKGQPIEHSEIDVAENFLKQFKPSKANFCENLSDIGTALKKSSAGNERLLKADFDDPQINAILAKFGHKKSHCKVVSNDVEDSDESESDSEIYDVIKQALLTPDDEDELNDEIRAKALGQ